MKRIALTLLLISLPLSVTSAHAESQNMGRATCGAPFDCSMLGQSDGAYSSEKIVSLAGSCVKNSFGTFTENDIFDTPYGLSAGQCLTPLVNKRVLTGGALTPHCCITEKDDNKCVLTCTLDFDQ